MVRTILAIILAYTPLCVLAEDVTVSWAMPTQAETCSDAGSVGVLGGTRIWMLVADTEDPDTTEYTFPDMPTGTYTYAATSYLEDGTESRMSGSVEKVVETFTAPLGSVVFQPTTISTGFWMLPIGTLSAETACDVTSKTTSGGTDYYRVPLDNVEWLEGSTARPIMVVAVCG